MTTWRQAAFAAAFILLGATAAGAQDGTATPATPGATGYVNPELVPRPTMHPTKVAHAPTIDAVLDEAEWRTAEVLTDFRQQLPNTGMPAHFRTEVRVLYDADHLYIAAENFDPEPGKAISAGLERDFQTPDSDIFGVALDTFHDRRNAFMFAINPAGGVRDEQVFNDSRIVVEAWEGIITLRTRMTDSSWIAELAIPMRTLRFDGGLPVQDWGVNFIRRVRRVNETSYWAPLERQYRLHRMSKAGTMAGLTGIQPGRNLQVKPYVVASDSRGAQVPAAALGTARDAGLDVKYGLTPSMTLDATYNTDFSQVEVDQEQVNLTRFSLFFPERREFFIENAGSFMFGDTEERNYRMGAGPKDFTLFNSRQIGLTADGRPIPIVGGGRVSGRAGAWELGLLDMQTQASAALPAENFGVVRVRRQVSGASDVGMLAQRRAATDGSGHENLSYGIDANLRPTSALILNAYYAASQAEGTASDGYTARLSASYRSAFWNTGAMWKRVSEDFDPGIGFVRRQDMDQAYATIGVHARPDWRGIQEVAPYLEVDHITDLRGALSSRSVQAGLDLLFQPDGNVKFTVKDEFDRLDAAFTVVPGRSVPVGAYGWREAEVSYTSGRSRRVYGTASFTSGGFYDGTKRSAGATLTWRPRYDLLLEANYTRNDVTLASGPFLADVGRLRVRYAWSTRLFGSAFVQYNAQSDTWVTNARLNYRYAPLSDVFLVYTDRRTAGTGVLGERTLALKFTRMLAF